MMLIFLFFIFFLNMIASSKKNNFNDLIRLINDRLFFPFLVNVLFFFLNLRKQVYAELSLY